MFFVLKCIKIIYILKIIFNIKTIRKYKKINFKQKIKKKHYETRVALQIQTTLNQVVS